MPVALKEVTLKSGVDYDWFVDAYGRWLRELGGDCAPQSEMSELDVQASCYRNHQRIFLIQRDNRSVGFAVLEGLRPVDASSAYRHASDGVYRVSDFFVETEERHLGVGAEAARLIFLRFRGPWEVSALATDREAIGFWRAIPNRFNFAMASERISGGHWILRFES